MHTTAKAIRNFILLPQWQSRNEVYLRGLNAQAPISAGQGLLHHLYPKTGALSDLCKTGLDPQDASVPGLSAQECIWDLVFAHFSDSDCPQLINVFLNFNL